jgi:tight adherence protein C
VSLAVWGGLLGGAAGLGMALVVSSLLAARRPSLESRVAPYIRDVPNAALRWRPRTSSDRPSAAVRALVVPLLESAARRLQSVLGGRESVRRRLERAGSAMTVEEFRLSQVYWGLSAFGASVVVGLLGSAREPDRALPWLILSSGVAVAAILARDSALSRRVRRREERMLAEFPVVADLLALAVAAGEGPASALDRVVTTCHGELPDELAIVLAQSRTGVPLARALDGFAQGFAVAIERGTPLVEVLAAQAADVREASRRALIETGARKEIAMMVPVVFLIMPVTLLFAFFPGVVGLNLLAP